MRLVAAMLEGQEAGWTVPGCVSKGARSSVPTVLDEAGSAGHLISLSYPVCGAPGLQDLPSPATPHAGFSKWGHPESSPDNVRE